MHRQQSLSHSPRAVKAFSGHDGTRSALLFGPVRGSPLDQPVDTVTAFVALGQAKLRALWRTRDVFRVAASGRG